MPAPNKPLAFRQPVVDEWGFYDPDQAGFAAVFARLEARAQDRPPAANASTLTGVIREVRKLQVSR